MAKKHTYVIFDGDKDLWAYARMKGWSALPTIDFQFDNAHDIGSMTSRAQNEAYVKSELRKRFAQTKQVVVIVGESTRFLYTYIRWEIDIAIELKLPIIAVYLNKSRSLDTSVCPPLLRGKNAIHIPFRFRIIKFTLDNFPDAHRANLARWDGSDRHYGDEVYQDLGLNDGKDDE